MAKKAFKNPKNLFKKEDKKHEKFTESLGK